MTVTDERGIVTCEYYPNGRLKSQSLPGSTTEKTSYEYYNNGNLKTITDPFGLAVEYDYDSNNRMDSISIGSKVFDYEYHEDGMLKSLQYPFEDRVVKSDFSYFDNNQLEILQNTIDSNIDSYEYTYDRQGNVTSLIESITCTPAIKPFDQEIVYEYDARGNRTQMQTEIFYQMVMGEFGYDTLNQLSQYIKDDNQHQYQYDVNGLRVKKNTPERTTQYIYGLGNKTIAETDGTGAVTAQIIWGHKPLARIINGQYYYYLYNGHGDVVQVIDENGNIVNSYAYDEWGNHGEWIDPVLGIENPIRYAGEYYDEESGLYYLRARYYDPSTGRFISRDTNEGKLTNPLSLNRYIYCLNNPLIFNDPSGFREVLLRDQIERAGGTIVWDDQTRTAIATVNGITTTYDPATDSRIRINDQGRIVIDNLDIDRDFSEAVKHVSADSRLGWTRFEVYQTRHGLSEIPGELYQAVTSPEAKHAFKSTAYTVINVHTGGLWGLAINTLIPSSGDPEFDVALKKVGYAQMISPNYWLDWITDLNDLKTLYNMLRR